MALDTFKHTPTFGPAQRSRLDLMGIRFADAGGDGAGAGGDDKGGSGGDDKDKGGDAFKAPANQAELDKILNGAVARAHAAAADKFKDYDTLKADAAELARIRNEKATPDEKAAKQIEDSREEGRAEIRKELAQERVKSAFDKALDGRALNAAALLDFDRSKFIKDGSADADAIKAWVETNSVEVKSGAGRDPGQGGRDARATGGSVQAGRDRFDNDKKPNRKE